LSRDIILRHLPQCRGADLLLLAVKLISILLCLLPGGTTPKAANSRQNRGDVIVLLDGRQLKSSAETKTNSLRPDHNTLGTG